MPPGPDWQDDPADDATIHRNVGRVVSHLGQQSSGLRAAPTSDDIRRWHTALYAGCSTPSPDYPGNYRGDTRCPDLADYEIAIGPRQPDGLPDRVGVWSSIVADEVKAYFVWLHSALEILDHQPRASTEAFLTDFVRMAATAHGEWVRIHPFANGNGRTARLLVAALCLHYRLPVFLAVKPRPANPDYARAARASMGRPPLFRGDHTATAALFAHYLSLAIAGA